MSLTIDVSVPQRPDGLPIFELSGEDDVSVGLLEHVRVDIEMPADDDGNPFLRVRLPDRKMLLIKSAPMPGELFFHLEEQLAGKPNRPIVHLNFEGEERDITAQLGWALLDFSGSWVRALRLAAQKKFDDAATEAAAAVVANSKDEGFRVVWGRFLLAAGKVEQGRDAFQEELALFPQSYRARAELAALDYKAGNREAALKQLLEGLALYPNHLKSLLLLADLLLAGGGDEGTTYLARAFRLSGSLAPQHIHTILERRRRMDLLPAVRAAAHKIDLGTPLVGDGVAVPTAEDRDTHRAVADSVEVAPAAPSFRDPADEATVDVAPVTKEDVIRLAAREVYRDGKVTPEEKLIFRQICRAFPIAAETISTIVKEEREGVMKRGATGGDFVAKDLFRQVLEIVYGDKKVTKDEVNLVMGLARTLGLSREECTEAQADLKKA